MNISCMFHCVHSPIMCDLDCASTPTSSASLPQFDATYYGSQLFWLIFSLVVLSIFLKFVIVPRINKVTGDRRGYIDSIEKSNSELEDDNNSLEQAITTKTGDAQLTSMFMIEQANCDKVNKIDNKIDMMNRIMSDNINSNIRQIINEKKMTIETLDKEIDDLSCLVIKKINGSL